MAAVVTATKIRATSGTSFNGSVGTPGAGNTLVTGFATYQGTESGVTITDDVNGAWTRVGGTDSSSFTATGSKWYRQNVAASVTTVTFNRGDASSFGGVGIVYEVSGMPTTGAFEGAPGVTTNFSTNAFTAAYTNVALAGIYFAFDTIDDGGASIVNTKDAAWSEHANAREADGSVYMPCAMEYLIVTTAASRSHTWTSDNHPWVAVLSFFKDAVQAAAPPSIGAAVITDGATATANAAVNYPTGITAGQLLLGWHRSADGTAAHGWPAGWNTFPNHVAADEIADASDDRTSLRWKLADGTETGTFTITQTSSKFASIVARVINHAEPSHVPPEMSAFATGTSTTPDPAAITPSGGVQDYLAIWWGTWEGEQTSPPTGNPTNYALNVLGAGSGGAGAVTTNCRVAIAARQLTAASTENPPSWTISASDDWTAGVVIVHPPHYERVGRPYGARGQRQMRQIAAL